MNGRIAVSFIFLLLFFQPVISQEKIVYNISYQQSYHFINNHNPDNRHYNTSFFINEMALSLGKKKSEINYELKYGLRKQIITHGQDCKGAASFTLKSIEGATNYRLFNVKQVLFPSFVNLDVFIFRDKNKLLLHKNLTGTIENGQANVSFDFISNDEDLIMRIEGIEFYYSDHDREKFMDATSQINDYYGSCHIIDSLLNDLKKYDSQIKNYPLKLIWTHFNLDQIYKKFENKAFIPQLKINQNDPLGFVKKMSELKLKKGRLKTLFVQYLEDKTVKSQAEINRQQLCTPYFNLLEKYISYARQANHYFSASYYNLLERKYSEKEISALVRNLSAYFMQTTGNKLKKNFFAESFVDSYLRIIDSCILMEYYNEALDLLTGLESFCSLGNYPCRENKIKAEKARGTVGLYNSLIKIVQRAIEIRNYQLAKTYINRADQFRSANSGFIISKQAIIRLHELLVASYIEYCTELNIDRNYKISHRLLNDALAIKQKYPDLNIDEITLDEQLDIAREGIYQSYLADASNYFNQGDYPGARRALNMAQQYQPIGKSEESDVLISESFNNDYPAYVALVSEAENLFKLGKYKESLLKYEEALQHDNAGNVHGINIDSLIHASALAYKDQLMYYINLNLWQKQIDEAESNIRALHEMLEKYNLSGRKDINEEIADIQNSLKQKKCEALWDQYEAHLLKTFDAIDNNDYLSAGNHLDEAIEVEEKFSPCNLTDSTAIHLLIKYDDPITYVCNRERIETQMFGDGFKNIIADYLELDSFFIQKQLATYGIHHISFIRFLMLQQNPQLILQAVDYFIMENDYERALDILTIIFETDYPINKTAKLQQQLAKTLAKLDFNTNKTSDFKQKTLEYTNGDNHLKYFKRAYKWKIIRLKIKDFYTSEKNKNSDN